MSAAEAAAGPGCAAPVSTRFLRSELRLIFGRRRNRAGLAVLAAVPIDHRGRDQGLAAGAGGRRRRAGRTSSPTITGNGLFVALAALTVELPLFLPLAVAAIAGDAVAGEANLGTLRYLLTVPVHRTRLLRGEVRRRSWSFAFAATLLVAAVGVLVGPGAVRRRRRHAAVRHPGRRSARALLRLLGVCAYLGGVPVARWARSGCSSRR